MEDDYITLPEFEGRIVSLVRADCAGMPDTGHYYKFHIYFTDGSSMTITEEGQAGWMSYDGGGHAAKG